MTMFAIPKKSAYGGEVLRAVPEIILGGTGTFLSCGGRVFCQRVRGVGGNLTWGSRCI